ncbi:MAG: MerR family transcriptional regulator [Anaerolineae bacterium]|nr:MerR family transcriptional regulator [Anaerolineae bacterium]
MKYLRTSDLAKAVGVHPNTVRRYAAWGLIPPVYRGVNGYRQFTQKHLDCLQVARLVYSTYPGKTIRQSGYQIIQRAVADDWGGALELSYAHLTLVQTERVQAEAAVMLLERWATGTAADATERPMQIGQAAKLLGVSIDMLRNWERNGLITIPRSANGYRYYGAVEISRLRVIRMLSRAGYSLMAILRMLLQLDRGVATNLRQSLDTPPPDEDVYVASDRWLSTLAEQEQIARQLIALVEDVIKNRTSRKPSLRP